MGVAAFIKGAICNERKHCFGRAIMEDIMSQKNLETVEDNRKSSTRSKDLVVLVVDDSATIRRSAETMLANEGYTVISAENGFEGTLKNYSPPPRPDLC